ADQRYLFLPTKANVPRHAAGCCSTFPAPRLWIRARLSFRALLLHTKACGETFCAAAGLDGAGTITCAPGFDLLRNRGSLDCTCPHIQARRSAGKDPHPPPE